MNSIQIKNLRSLQDTGEIEMKKVNVLVGGNSSGKSTFLRIFPLFKQSFSKRINGPILWCGDDDDYVDFGSFEEALNYNVKDKNSTMQFLFNFTSKFRINSLINGTILRKNLSGNVTVNFAISHNQKTTYDYISKLTLLYKNYLLEIIISDKNIIKSITLNHACIELITPPDNMYDYSRNEGIFDISLSAISQTANNKIFKLLDLETAETERYYNLIPIISDALENGKNSRIRMTKKIYEKIDYLKTHDLKVLSELEKWIYLFYVPKFFSLISDYLINYFKNVYYIAPVRATAERYYKLRNLAVDEVDCRGKNLPIFLNSLREKSFQSFQQWTLDNLGFKVDTSVSEGHVSIKIQKEGQTKAVNLSDTGFGYSQILPIVTQLWYIAVGIKEKRTIQPKFESYNIPKTIVIEQPELHLHPALQAKLIDIIVKVATEKNINFIIETHSETMINRIGALIDNKKIESDDVGIIIFNKNFGDDESQISKSSFDQDGYLKDWPIGFFEPEEE